MSSERHLLGVALALALCGCPTEHPDAGPPPVGPKAAPRADLPPWAASRVGDRVDYVLVTENVERGGGNRREGRWTLSVEVVKVEPATVWVAVKGQSAAGRALGFLIAVDPRAAPAGPARDHRQAADGGTFELHAGGTCRPWEVDQRKRDGTRVAGCASDVAPFHLLRGLAFERSVSGLIDEAQRDHLEAVSATRGPEPAAAGALPDLPVLFPPQGWYRRIASEANPQQSAVQVEEQVVGGTIVRRMRSLADLVRTRDDLARTDLTQLGGRHYIVADQWYPQAIGELAQAVIAIARAVDGPLVPGEARVLTVSTGTLATRLAPDDSAFAADVFDAKLAGLPWGGRAEAVQTRRDRLWDWGSGPMPMAPPAAPGTLPETLSAAEVDAVVQAVHAESGCFKPRDSGPVSLKLTLAPDGKPTKVVATAANKKAARCIEKALMKRTWPAYAGPKRSFEAELDFP